MIKALLLIVVISPWATADVPPPNFVPVPRFEDPAPFPRWSNPPIEAPTESVPADAVGHWEVQRKCSPNGPCSLQQTWVPGEESQPTSQVYRPRWRPFQFLFSR